MITGAKKVRVGVADQQRAKEFWVEKLGARVARDERYGDERWIEVRLPDGLLVVLELRDGPAPQASERLPNTPVFLACDDLDATHRELSRRGVRFVQEPIEEGFGTWSLFADDEGNRFALEAADR